MEERTRHEPPQQQEFTAKGKSWQWRKGHCARVFPYSKARFECKFFQQKEAFFCSIGLNKGFLYMLACKAGLKEAEKIKCNWFYRNKIIRAEDELDRRARRIAKKIMG